MSTQELPDVDLFQIVVLKLCSSMIYARICKGKMLFRKVFGKFYL